MSHTMNIKTELKDPRALEAACSRLGYKMEHGSFQLFDRSTKETGIGIKLPEWRYPIVVKPDASIAFDNYEGQWGNISKLNELIAYYGLEKAKIEARKKGYSVYETRNDQTNKLELRIRGM